MSVQPPPITPIPARYHWRFGYLICDTCGLEARYCRCSERTNAAPPGDGAESSLNARIRDARRMMRGKL
jgi:hypothetical protein